MDIGYWIRSVRIFLLHVNDHQKVPTMEDILQNQGYKMNWIIGTDQALLLAVIIWPQWWR